MNNSVPQNPQIYHIVHINRLSSILAECCLWSLLEEQFPWTLVEAIGVFSQTQYEQVSSALKSTSHQPPVSVQRNWYY